MFLLAAGVFTPITMRWYGWPALRGALRTRTGLIVVVGLLQAAAYLLVLYVYARAPVAYAGAIRESSIVLGALAGWLWLRESFGARRLAGALLTCAGIALIALAGSRSTPVDQDLPDVGVVAHPLQPGRGLRGRIPHVHQHPQGAVRPAGCGRSEGAAPLAPPAYPSARGRPRPPPMLRHDSASFDQPPALPRSRGSRPR